MEFKIELNSVKDIASLKDVKGLYSKICIHISQAVREVHNRSENYVTKMTIQLEFLSDQGQKQTIKFVKTKTKMDLSSP